MHRRFGSYIVIFFKQRQRLFEAAECERVIADIEIDHADTVQTMGLAGRVGQRMPQGVGFQIIGKRFGVERGSEIGIGDDLDRFRALPRILGLQRLSQCLRGQVERRFRLAGSGKLSGLDYKLIEISLAFCIGGGLEIRRVLGRRGLGFARRLVQTAWASF